MVATALDLSQIKTDALSSAATFRSLIELGSTDTPTFAGTTIAGDIQQKKTGSFAYFGAKDNGTQSKVRIDGNTETVSLSSTTSFAWTSGNYAHPSIDDLILYRDAAGILAQRNGTNANEYRVYNTFTDASNYERGFLKWDANVFKIGTEATGTGSGRPVHINSTSLSIGDNYSVKHFMFNGNALQLRGIGELTWGTSNDAGSASYSVKLIRDFDLQGVLAQQSGTQPQTYRIYNTTNGTNYERAFLQWDSNVFKIGTEAAGTGTARTLTIENVAKINGSTSSAADPSTTEYPNDGDHGIHKNTTSGNVFLAYNDGGSSIVKVQLS